MNRPDDVTELHWSAQAGDVDRIVHEVSSGADVNARDQHGNTPLKYASCEPHPAAVAKLLELGASATLADHRGFTPLHGAAGHGFWKEAVEIAKLLLDHGANPNAQSREFGFVPLHEATGKAMIELLLAVGADPSIRNADGLTPLEYMIEDERFDDAECLKQRTSLKP